MANLNSLSLQLNPYRDLKPDKIEATLADFFVNLRRVEHFKLILNGNAENSRALSK